ncbi:hypothetical protein [Oscillatoria sp. FACHB-1406]|uniref:hypothetical protein n=1 Tax=Oscillatoria sp. FACHB-1406 TaxID=2692846 RepID=UPI001683FF56|nr:hypothetical protein [Oscillatoria sp. FACHB-1406]MBD2579647.1 hypothetical protein [Oscillatoria sp. FACHB-1406]
MSKSIFPFQLSRSLFIADLGSPKLTIIAEEAPPPKIELREPVAAPSLIDVNAQSLGYVGVILFALTIAAAVGLVRRRRVIGIILALMGALAIAAFVLPRRFERLQKSPRPESLLDKGSHQT